jgi:hypothetical protein
VLKSKEDLFGRTSLAGVGWERVCFWAGCHQGEGRGVLLPPAQILARPASRLLGQVLMGQAYPDSLLRVRPLSVPTLTWRLSETKGQHAGQDWNVSLLWLAGDSGPPGSGEHEGMYGGYHSHVVFQRGTQCVFGSGFNTPCWREVVLSLPSCLGVGWDWILWDERRCKEC